MKLVDLQWSLEKAEKKVVQPELMQDKLDDNLSHPNPLPLFEKYFKQLSSKSVITQQGGQKMLGAK